MDMKQPLHQRCLHEHRCMKTIYIMHAIGINVQISLFISVEKKLTCGEISDFCKEFEQFMEVFLWRKICLGKK